MSATSKFYLEQAAISGQAADLAKLANERDKCLRAQAAWQALADKLIRAETMRARKAEEKADEVESMIGAVPFH